MTSNNVLFEQLTPENAAMLLIDHQVGTIYLVRLALTLPALFIALGAPIVGIAIDQFGRKPILLFSLALYGIAGSSGFILNSLESMLVGRAFLGISVAGIMTIATTLVGDYYSGNSRAQFLGWQSAFMGLGGVLFLSVGGFVADLNWRFPFLIYLMALILLPCALLFLPEPQRSSPGTVNTDAATTKFPLTPVAITYGIALISQIVFYLIPVQLPFYLKQIANTNASQSGLAIALVTLFSAISSLNFSTDQSETRFHRNLRHFLYQYRTGIRTDCLGGKLSSYRYGANPDWFGARAFDAKYEFLFNLDRAR